MTQKLFKDNSQLKRCLKCHVPFVQYDPRETYSYFIGKHEIKVVVNIPKGKCHSCGAMYESDGARNLRNDAFKKAINQFWLDVVRNLSISEQDMAMLEFTIGRIMINVGKERKREVAAELGRWLAGCVFVE